MEEFDVPPFAILHSVEVVAVNEDHLATGQPRNLTAVGLFVKEERRLERFVVLSGRFVCHNGLFEIQLFRNNGPGYYQPSAETDAMVAVFTPQLSLLASRRAYQLLNLTSLMLVKLAGGGTDRRLFRALEDETTGQQPHWPIAKSYCRPSAIVWLTWETARSARTLSDVTFVGECRRVKSACRHCVDAAAPNWSSEVGRAVLEMTMSGKHRVKRQKRTYPYRGWFTNATGNEVQLVFEAESLSMASEYAKTLTRNAELMLKRVQRLSVFAPRGPGLEVRCACGRHVATVQL